MDGGGSGAQYCQLCGEPILPGEPLFEATFNGAAVHYECGFRAIMGGMNHILGRCSCQGGEEEPDPPGLTRRQAAQFALKAWREKGGIPESCLHYKPRPCC